MKKIDPRRLATGVFPILEWSREYNPRTGVGDLIAGVTVALTLIPQSIAYASLAGFEPQVGGSIKIVVVIFRVVICFTALFNV